MLSTKTLPNIIHEKLLIQNSHSNGHLTSFDALIIEHVICPTAVLLVDSDYQELKNFSKGQRRKYGTIVNISKNMKC